MNSLRKISSQGKILARVFLVWNKSGEKSRTRWKTRKTRSQWQGRFRPRWGCFSRTSRTLPISLSKVQARPSRARIDEIKQRDFRLKFQRDPRRLCCLADAAFFARRGNDNRRLKVPEPRVPAEYAFLNFLRAFSPFSLALSNHGDVILIGRCNFRSALDNGGQLNTASDTDSEQS